MAKKVTDTTLSTQIASRLSNLRKEKGITLENLAYEAEMELTQVHRVLSGDHDNRISTLSKVCKALGISLSELFKGL